MRTAERSAEVNASAHEVFTFITEIANLPRWQSGVERAEQTSTGPMSVGSTASVARRVLGQRVDAELRLAELVPDRRMVLETDASGLHLEARVDIAPLDETRCQVTFGMAMEATSIFMRAAEPMIAQAAEADIGESLARLQEVFAAH